MPTVTPARQVPSVESRASWTVAFAALGVLSFAYAAPLIAVVAMKPIAAELGSARTVPAWPARSSGSAPAWAASAWG